MSDGRPAAANAPPVLAGAPASRFMPVVMASALFMDLLDTAALGTALPTMAREFHTEPVHFKLALTAYLMTMAILVPASGWLADRFGARRVFVNAVRIYLIGSLCCGLSNSLAQLVAARVLQGIGGAMMTPVARLIVVAMTPREQLVSAMNIFTMPAVLGPLLGPPLAGFLLQVASWRWIFFLNLPVGILGIVTVLRVLPRLRHPHPGPFDALGFVTAGLGIVGTIGLAESMGSGLLSGRVRLVVAICTLALWVFFARHALRARCPILNLRLFTVRTFRASMVGGAILRLGMGATPFLVPLQLQSALHWPPVKAGLVMSVMMLGSLLARFGGTVAVRLAGFRRSLLVTAVLAALLTAAPASFALDTQVACVCMALLAVGFFRAAHYVAATAIGFADVPPGEVSRASTLSTVIQQLSLSFGISFAGAALYLSAGDSTPTRPHQFVTPFLALGVVSFLALPVYAVLDAQAGSHMRFGRRAS
ncbi:MAG TPA: DHA2 family efflux MFS transporter permease subunit [Steroidobacteraceae bacterium]|nr:DHA2 family efflux MFS transporter permease subunit [Steroidobacteraceae bacterium]